MPDKLKLHTLLGDHPGAMALKNKSIASDLIDFDFADVKVPNTAFKALVREFKFDLAELAIVTFLQAKVYGKPYALIPATIMGRGQLHTIFYNPSRGALAPRDLSGKRLGVRSYTQTTGAWVRGILADDCGVDSNKVTWVTFEDPHLAEYKDPPNVARADQGKTLEQMLLGGEIDAAILPNVPQPPLAPLFPDAAEIDRKWAEKNGGVPVNHMLVIRSGIAKERPDVVREVYRLFLASKNAALAGKPAPALDPIRFGIESNRRTLEIVIDYSLRQKLIPRRFSVDELFEDTRAALA